jgi:phage FluMu protein gp41
MVRSLLANWRMDEKDAPIFVYYLNRHIELDGDSHGPAAWKIINELAGNDPTAIAQIKSSAEEAIAARIGLWDGLAERLSR